MSTSTATTAATATTLLLPVNDKRSYRSLTLAKNGLSFWLVSDPDTEQGAAAMAVSVGQLHDFLPGLAHLTEHMVTMGSQQYPDENEFNRYLAAAGGHTNAYTDLELTCYYFDCQATHLPGALDRLAAALTKPLFDPSTVERELQAVDSEHASHVQDDHWCMHHLVRLLLGRAAPNTPAHPYASFGTGNRASLAPHGIATLQHEVTRFYQTYYTAENMTVVILGKQPLDQLETWAIQYFSDIPTRRTTNDSQPPVSPPLTPSLPLRVHVVPIRDHSTVHVLWPLPPILPHYRSKPTRVLSHLLGHEGPGSLLAALRQRQWAHELVADDASKSLQSFSILEVQIEVTPDGLHHVNDIIHMLYAYLALLVNDPIPTWVYEELQATAEMQFRFLSKTDPSDTASTLAVHMHHYAPEHVVAGPLLVWDDYDPARMQPFLQRLTPHNMLWMVCAKEFDGTTDQVSQWYGTKYRIVEWQDGDDNDGDGLLEQWTKTLRGEHGGTGSSLDVSDLKLPEPNDMIATNFDLVEAGAAFAVVNDQQPTPRCLMDTPTCRLWYKPDTAFDMPKVNLMITLRTATVYASSPLHSVLASLWVEWIREQCNEFAYAASMAGLHCDFNNTRTGMELHVSGYNHKAGILLQRIVDTVTTSMTDDHTLSNKLFARIVDKLSKQFTAFLVAQAYQHAMYASDLVLEDLKWTIQERMESLKQVSRDDLMHYSKDLLSRFHMELLVHGNVSPQEAIAFSEMIQKGWNPKPSLQLPSLRVTQLTSTETLYRLRSYNPQEANNAITNVYQFGPMDLRTNAALSLLNHFIKEPAFNQLRTEEQLGYIIHTGIKTSGDTVKGILILIQGDSFDPIHMDERIETFLVDFRSMIVDMTADEFKANSESVSSNMLEKNKNLGEESSKHWNVITNQTYNFRRLEQIAMHVKGLVKSDVLRLFDKYLLKSSPYRRKLSVQVFGSKHADKIETEVPAEVTVVQSPQEFRLGQPLFPAVSAISGAVCVSELMLTTE